MKSAVPRKIVNASGRFEEDNRRTRGSWRVAIYELRGSRDLEIIESADKSAFDALGEEIFYHSNHTGLPIIILFIAKSNQQVARNFLEEHFIFFRKMLFPAACLP